MSLQYLPQVSLKWKEKIYQEFSELMHLDTGNIQKSAKLEAVFQKAIGRRIVIDRSYLKTGYFKKKCMYDCWCRGEETLFICGGDY